MSETPPAPADAALPWILGAGALAVYAVWMGTYLYAAGGTIGHDFGGLLPALLDGVYWFRTNGLTTPWFTPGFCGGIPAFPEPQSSFWSATQLLAFVVDPLHAAFLSTVLFGAIGYAGTVVLARGLYAASGAASALAATIFLFNDFYGRRMLTGSFGYQPYALVPLTAWVLLRPEPWRIGRWSGGNALVGGLLIAGWLMGGLTTLMIPSALAVLALALTMPDPAAAVRRLVMRGLPAGAYALGLCAAKLAAATAFMRHFKRDAYPLPGFGDPLTAASFAIRSLFWPSEALAAEAEPLLRNRMWAVEPQEWAYGLTVVPLLLLVAGLGLTLIARRRGLLPRLPVARQLGLLALVPLLLLPVALTTYTPAWNAFLKGLPIVGQTSFPFRWVILAIPLICVAAGRVLDHVLIPVRARLPLLAVSVLATIALHASEPDAWYRVDGAFYNPGPVRTAWHAPTPPITAMVDYQTARDREATFYSPNDFVTKGWSTLDCYAPIFGYRQEYLPRGSLHPGPALSLTDGAWNVKNPACYVFPEENGCAPGDHFPEAQRAEAEAFLAWKPFPFAISGRQAAANTVTGVFLAAAAVGVALMVWARRP